MLDSKPLLAIPVGFICLLACETSPAELFGGVWERISQGRAIYGAGSLNGIDYVANSTKEAGLPNITGRTPNDSFTTIWFDNDNNFEIEFEGAFDVKERRSGGVTGNTGRTAWALGFDASKSNAVYGNSSTVQPNAYICYVWKKIE